MVHSAFLSLIVSLALSIKSNCYYFKELYNIYLLTYNLKSVKLLFVIYMLQKMGRKIMNRVKIYRKKKGLSQMELSTIVGVARQTITLIENGKYNPSLALCIKISKALDSDLNSIFWEETENE